MSFVLLAILWPESGVLQEENTLEIKNIPFAVNWWPNWKHNFLEKSKMHFDYWCCFAQKDVEERKQSVRKVRVQDVEYEMQA